MKGNRLDYSASKASIKSPLCTKFDPLKHPSNPSLEKDNGGYWVQIDD